MQGRVSIGDGVPDTTEEFRRSTRRAVLKKATAIDPFRLLVFDAVAVC